MHDREDSGETEADKNTSSKRSIKRGLEVRIQRYDSAGSTNCGDLRLVAQRWFVMRLRPTSTYHTPVESLQNWLAVEAIVYAWDETSRDENDNAEVIGLIRPLIDLRS